MTTPQTATTKIVIASGQEFSVPIETDNEAIRQQLAGMGFADVAAATIQKGTRDVDGQKVETIEFVKKAGTKGLDGAALAALIATLEASSIPPIRMYGPTASQASLLAALADGDLTFEQAITHDGLDAALTACGEQPPSQAKKGVALCNQLSQLVAVPCAAPVVW